MDDELKTIAYEYAFTYFGDGTVDGKFISGASAIVAIRPYKNGKEVRFDKEPVVSCDGRTLYLCDAYDVLFDPDILVKLRQNVTKYGQLCKLFGFDEITATIVGYSLSYLYEPSDDEKQSMPSCMQTAKWSRNMDVDRIIFEQFLREHIDEFHTTDNQLAQVPSYQWL